MTRRLLRTPLTWLLVPVVAAIGVFGLYWFQPWKLVTDREVSETLSTPQPVPSVSPGSTSSASSAAASPPAAAAPPAAAPALVRQGEFLTHEHETSGTARIVRAADGSHRLELVGLATSNGPDLRVWLTDQPVREGRAGWRVFDDGEWFELGRLKGNRGDQAYAIPATLDLGQISSVSIWCRRFAVSFGAAPLRPV
jgi:Electron transfer DM13